MSAITASPVASRRPTTVAVASVLIVLLGLSVLIPFPGTGEIPRAALIIGYALAALKVVAGVGVWLCRKWAAILGFVIVLLDALLSAPGAVAAPSAALQVFIIVGILVSIVALVLLALPASRRAYA